MTTFDAISHIRREALSPADAIRFLMEHFGFSAIYARELISAAGSWDRTPRPTPVPRPTRGS